MKVWTEVLTLWNFRVWTTLYFNHGSLWYQSFPIHAIHLDLTPFKGHWVLHNLGPIPLCIYFHVDYPYINPFNPFNFNYGQNNVVKTKIVPKLYNIWFEKEIQRPFMNLLKRSFVNVGPELCPLHHHPQFNFGRISILTHTNPLPKSSYLNCLTCLLLKTE